MNLNFLNLSRKILWSELIADARNLEIFYEHEQ